MLWRAPASLQVFERIQRGCRLRSTYFFSTAKKIGKKDRSKAMLFIQQSTHFCRVQLDPLEAQLLSVEQLDKRTPRGTSGLGVDNI
jgi:hypothetical protein